jgi:hypothetical protein
MLLNESEREARQARLEREESMLPDEPISVRKQYEREVRNDMIREAKLDRDHDER